MPLEGEIGNLCHRSIGRMLDNCNLRSLDASLAIPTRVLRFEVSRLRRRTPVRSIPTSQTVLELLHLRLRFFVLGFVDQPKNLVVFW
jgi:hypothetical protein